MLLFLPVIALSSFIYLRILLCVEILAEFTFWNINISFVAGGTDQTRIAHR
jgi:hypothetical protein